MKKQRTAKTNRKTTETNISVQLNLDGTGKYSIDTGLGFFNHMLELLSKHSLIDLSIKARSDLRIDEHHKIEAMFKAVAKSLKMAVENDPRMKNILPSTKGNL